jgi:CheY-like chemotaxis protein
MNILLIEDEILIQKSLSKMLSLKGHDVTVSSSGKKAISYIKEQKFERIVCDLMLQDITGFDVIEESKKHMAPQSIKDIFIIMTAYTSEQVVQKAKEYGCPVLNKPFEDIHSAINLIENTQEGIIQ